MHRAPVRLRRPCALPVNAGDADVKGIEVETTLRPVEGLLIDGVAELPRFPVHEHLARRAVPTGNARADCGMYPPYTPKWKWSVGAQYESVSAMRDR